MKELQAIRAILKFSLQNKLENKAENKQQWWGDKISDFDTGMLVKH